MTFKRFDFGTCYSDGAGVPDIIQKTDGRYMLVADFERLMAVKEKAIEGLMDQHARDSAELRRLCADRDNWRGLAQRRAEAAQMRANTPPRWYMLDKNGVATLCVDEADAKAVAADAEKLWPQNAPYVAVQLVPAQAVTIPEDK